MGLTNQEVGVGKKVTEYSVQRYLRSTSTPVARAARHSQLEKEPKLAVWFWIIDIRT